jgi:hypothetical protein
MKLFSLVFALCAGATFAPALTSEAASAAATSTAVTHVRPVDASGRLLPGYRVTRNLGKAQCLFGSEATGTAYRCFAGNFVIDPCWVADNRSYADCLSEGWGHAVWRLHVTKGFDNSGFTTHGSRGALPWGVQEVGGIRCGFAQGASGGVGKYRINYFCPKTPKEALVGDVDRSTGPWTIRRARDTGHGHYVRDGRVQLERVWYGKPSRKG